MINSKIVALLFCLSITISSCTFIGNVFRLGYTEEQCKQIKTNLNQLKIGMTKPEVVSLIGEDSPGKVYRYPGFFPEQKNEWEIWLLCKEKPYQWHMIAFDVKTGKLVKVFLDNSERVGFE